jgi:hypothetical protein
LDLINNDSLERVVLNSLNYCGGALRITGNATLKDVQIPSVVQFDHNFHIHTNPELRSINAPNAILSSDVNCSGCSLDETSINQILARCVVSANNITSINLSGGSNAAPTGQGLIDKATLESLDKTVLTN